jgi:hypothetical protein
MKKIGFLSFGHWTPSSQSLTRSAAQEAEAVRIRKQAEIDALQKELRSARQEILALQAANAIAPPRGRRHGRDIRTAGSDAVHM